MNLTNIVLSIFLAASQAPTDDSIFSALRDELKRTSALRLEGQPPPYFVCYTVREVDEFDAAASLGALCLDESEVDRYLIPSVRVGSYDLDNTNFALAPISPTRLRESLPTDDYYPALRRKIWLATDNAYKAAIENLQAKKAYLKENRVPDRMADLTHEDPVVSVGSLAALKVDRPLWVRRVKELSGMFNNFPEIQRSRVSFLSRSANRWLLSSEGTQIRDGSTKCAVIAKASTQASDGERIADAEIFMAPTPDQLPDEAEMSKQVRELAQRVQSVSKAPIGEEYLGPVLLEGQAAAQFVSQLLAANFGFAQEPLGLKNSQQNWHNPFKDAMGRRILPSFISVVDDPTARIVGKRPLIGGYTFDDDGVRAQRVSLVENGVLKSLCTSRVPTKWGKHSNGHSVLGVGVRSMLFFQSSKTLSPSALRARLLALGKEEGLKYVLVIKRMFDDYDFREHPEADHPDVQTLFDTPSSTVKPSSPVSVYKVYVDDGHEELIRGLEFKYVTMRSLRDIDCTGDDAAAFPVQPSGETVRHLVTPSLLIKELELSPEENEHDEPPILSSPLLPDKAK